jgi:hypothetical protein
MPKKTKPKLSCKQKTAFIKEEKQTAKLYRKLGFPTQGRQEQNHSQFFKKQPCRK